MRVLDTEIVGTALGGLARPPESVLVVEEVLDMEGADDWQQLAPGLQRGREGGRNGGIECDDGGGGPGQVEVVR